MSLSLRPEHLRRYRDLSRLLVKYGRSDVVREIGLEGALDGGPLPNGAAGVDGPVPPEAEELAADLESLGPTYIKLGQLLSTRSDLLPAAYLQALTRLQDDVEPFPFDDVQAIVEADLRRPLAAAYARFDPEPLAAASLGQVHRARLVDGPEVAVKVQRPDIRARIADDMAVLAELASFLDRRTEAGRRFGFAGMLDEFRRSLTRELDYGEEASNLETLRANLAGFDRIVVPAPIRSHCGPRVLTMEFVGGRKVTELGPLALAGVDGAELGDQLFRAYLHQVLVHGFFHADPHPGNVFLTDDRRLALVDLGMVARVSPEMQDSLLRLLLAASEGRGEDVADAALGLGERREDFDEAGFTRAVAALVAEQQGRQLHQVSAGSVVVELTRIAGESGLRPAPELAMLGKALLNVDQVARSLDPSYDPNEAIRDEAASIMRHRFLGAVSPGNMLAAAMDAKEFVEKLPGRVNKVMDALAEGQLTLNVQGIDERQLMRGIQKLANRVTMGLVLAALIVGAAMLMRVPTSSKLFGYPTVAIVCFLAAACGAFALLAAIVVGDRRK
ncbi:MAG TPA: AarF/UbiB family protein [Acidimicrobiales bacterium]|jgi:predicted unusual protein kinase regulating ubiquinone biosynthesis (AarF/ABC1/UbiB family)|nr:AarF/UbiB family protein [Acidimicrobiales bacterium]